MNSFAKQLFSFAVIPAILVGCSDSAPVTNTPPPDASESVSSTTDDTSTDNAEVIDDTPKRRSRGPIDLSATNTTDTTETKVVGPDPDAVLAKMQPLQIVLGKWRGTTRKTFGMFKAVDSLLWVWDFQTDRNQPALVITSDASPYIRDGRLTYSLQDKKYKLSTQDQEGIKREFLGEFIQEPADEPGDDDKPQRTFKLEFTETERKDAEPRWQIVFNQQENNRYLMELSRARASGKFNKLDTVGTQREDTSFALNLDDYKEMTCVVSQGKGTIQVSHKGKTYWVCCTGCKATFEDEPEVWLARMAEKQKEKE